MIQNLLMRQGQKLRLIMFSQSSVSFKLKKNSTLFNMIQDFN